MAEIYMDASRHLDQALEDLEFEEVYEYEEYWYEEY